MSILAMQTGKEARSSRPDAHERRGLWRPAPDERGL